MSFLRRIFGRDVKTDTAVQNGYTLVADDTKTSGLDWSDILIRGGLGRDLVNGINRLAGNSFNIDTVFLPGEYYFDVDTLGDKPCNYGLLKVWRESSGVVYQIIQSAHKNGNKMFSRYYNAGTWGPWTEYATTSSIPSASEYVLVQLTGSGNFTVPAGVTSIKVTAVSGGLGGVVWEQGSRGGDNGCLYIRKQPGQPLIKNITVTPGDVISYTCGVGQVFSFFNTASVYYAIKEISATNTVFGTEIDVEPPLARFSITHRSVYGNAVFGQPENSGYCTSMLPGGRLPRGLVTENDTSPFYSTGTPIESIVDLNPITTMTILTDKSELNSFHPSFRVGVEPYEQISATLSLSGAITYRLEGASTSHLEAGDPGYIIVEYSQ